MSAPAPTSSLLARALNPVAAVATGAASSTSAVGTEMLASGLATSSSAIVSTTAASTTHIAAGRSAASVLRTSTSTVLAGSNGSFASARTFTTSAAALVKEAPATAKPTAPATSVLREAARNPEANSRIRITDGPPPDLSYVPEGTPITSEDPKHMPAASASAIPASQSQHASTKSGAAHPGAAEMAQGATLPEGGEDAITPEERSMKAWGPNQRTPEYNTEEGRRNPVLHGGSNEGGFGADGKSKT
ncbi:hypothetical protein OC834_002986 [Tilletia horrida]|uniref:Uncharacterized protein n=1 Tax=Tilletia horrida TaxID=155126 RepID=A0AAN6JQQ9_9BASI|nr:hypothetical protein OC842_003965 [Tilletia horrida]KAK0531341.1 hypothetical protein OC834_002986 [Tilletia horrida]KAK0534123.1 hypothetical protein OC835_002787 [Tilletia horrida]KAK0561947.1 hypothetical protein OC844_002952 [Tilletia horrida]